MSNQIFCKVNKEMCDTVKAIAGDRIVVDCGAGRGLFASMYDGKVLSIDIHQPDEPLSFIIEKNAEHYCFPKKSIPIFIRPCHSNFVHNTILKNRNKFDKAIYVSLPKNLDGDLDDRFYKITQYSEWEGEEGERIYLVELNNPKESFSYLSGKIIHFADPMLSCLVETQEQEFKESVESPLEDRGILIDGLRLTLTDMYPSGEKYDYLFFDYGGMSIGNSLMESFCREIVRDADMYPNRTYVVVSTFTSYAMKDAKEDFGKDLPNVFLSISDFVTFHKRLNQLTNNNIEMNIGLIDVDGHNFPNFALMRSSAYYKARGAHVEWATPFNGYDKVLASKVFTFTPDFNYLTLQTDVIEKGGTGYDIQKKLPSEIENSTLMDYSIYPQYPFSIQFFSRGCIRKCPFCLVREKEGYIQSVEPVDLNPKGKWIEVLDNNFFANPEWHGAVDYLLKAKQPVKLHGVDVRIMDEEQAYWLNKLKMKQNIHIAWDLPKIDLTDRLKEMVKYVKPYKITCYVLVGFNSTIEQDLFRLNTLKSLGITPFVQPYRDFVNERKPKQYELDLARWANKMWLFKSFDFASFSPRKGFKCDYYLKQLA